MSPPLHHLSVTLDRSSEAALPRLRASGWRRVGIGALALAPVAVLVAADVARRHAYLEHLVPEERHFYLRTVVVTAALVTSLFVAASGSERTVDAIVRRNVARVLLVAAALLTVGAQVYTFGRYHAYLNPRAILVGTSMLPSIGQQVWMDRWTVARALLPPLAVAIVWPLLLRRLARVPAAASRLALDVAIVALGSALFVDPSAGGEQGGTPEFMYVSAMGQLARAHWGHNEYALKSFPEARTPEPLPALVARPARPRNVLLILDESVRQMSVCNAFREDCVYTPRTNRAAPDRIALDQVRAVDSTTAISLGVVFNGLVPTASRRDLHSAPLLWEYAHAAGLGTDYWTSQNLLFGNSGTWLEGLPLDHHASATDLDPGAPLETGADDGALVDRVLADLRDSASAGDARAAGERGPPVEHAFSVHHRRELRARSSRTTRTRPRRSTTCTRTRCTCRIAPSRACSSRCGARRPERRRWSSSPAITASSSARRARSGTPGRCSIRRCACPSGSTRRRAR